MKRLALAILVIAACSGSKQKQGTSAGSGSGSQVVYAKKLSVVFGITQKEGSAELFLQTTDETGKQVSYPVGTFQGTCQAVKPADDMKALVAVDCMTGTSGTEIQAAVSGGDIVVLKLAVTTGIASDPMAREEVTRVKAPAGSSIEPG